VQDESESCQDRKAGYFYLSQITLGRALCKWVRRMRWPFEAASAIAALVIGFCTIRYLATVFLWPTYAVAQENGDVDRHRTVLWNSLHYGYRIATFLGVAFCVYQGVAVALRWIPQSWVMLVIDDTDRDGVEFSIAFLASFFAALGLLSGMSKLSNQIVHGKIQMEQLRNALEQARGGPK
jgi:hypothetical protein